MTFKRIINNSICVAPSLLALPLEVRYVFVVLITIADDLGQFPADLRRIKALGFPMDDPVTLKMIGAWLDELERAKLPSCRMGSIRRYKTGGQEYFYIINWFQHQNLRGQRRGVQLRILYPLAPRRRYPSYIADRLAKQLEITVGVDHSPDSKYSPVQTLHRPCTDPAPRSRSRSRTRTRKEEVGSSVPSTSSSCILKNKKTPGESLQQVEALLDTFALKYKGATGHSYRKKGQDLVRAQHLLGVASQDEIGALCDLFFGKFEDSFTRKYGKTFAAFEGAFDRLRDGKTEASHRLKTIDEIRQGQAEREKKEARDAGGGILS